ncbi:hypothetical protein [uncultured Desulfovibrio sp.]|uniref:hypothetical protein n=1 Tax=uncultured Desulfovibrio sp. TaxID=167968 RepID=UPI002618A1C4|nr:hypothetical protein [uncultured Desulfovibrio sp.]
MSASTVTLSTVLCVPTAMSMSCTRSLAALVSGCLAAADLPLGMVSAAAALSTALTMPAP